MLLGAHDLPLRYEPLALLGSGASGLVFSVRDILTGETLALKLLAPEGGRDEFASILREASFLADAEGLGLPEMRAFGRTREGRGFLVRTMIEGVSLEKWARGRNAADVVGAVTSAMAAVAVLHRFGLLHGDLKPANIVVDGAGRGHLVDLGLAVPWSGDSTLAFGFTPNYAAPEVLSGACLDGRTEVFALACTLRDALAVARPSVEIDQEMSSVIAEGTDPQPSRRSASVDEFLHRIRRALCASAPGCVFDSQRLDRWGLVGLDRECVLLAAQTDAWRPDAIFRIGGPPGSGVSTLLRRWAWTSGARGISVELLAGRQLLRAHDTACEEALALVADGGFLALDGCVLSDEYLENMRSSGARRGVRIVVGGDGRGPVHATPAPLTAAECAALVHRVHPELGAQATAALIARAHGSPGSLRASLAALVGRVVVSVDDLDGRIADAEAPVSLLRVSALLARGRVADAETLLVECTDRSTDEGIHLSARILLGRGAAEEALLLTESGRDAAGGPVAIVRARALLRLGRLPEALEVTSVALQSADTVTRAEALALRAVTFSFRGALDEALAAAEGALGTTPMIDDRLRSIVHGSYGIVLHRRGDRFGAMEAQERALACAEASGDASLLAVARLNLAALAQESGDLGRAIQSLEPVAAMADQAGQLLVVQQALANLASLYLTLGRIEQARSTLDALGREAHRTLSVEAHRLALDGEWNELTNNATLALRYYAEAADAWEGLGRRDEAAFIRLEAAVLALRTQVMTIDDVESLLASEVPHLATRGAHPLPELLRAAVAEGRGFPGQANAAIDRAWLAAKEAGLDDWLVRVQITRARQAAAQGDHLRAAREQEGARAMVEESAARLPPDLREVFWNDPRRRHLRTRGSVTVPRVSNRPGPESVVVGGTSDRLARILALTASLLAVATTEGILEGILDHAMALVHGHRGLLLLRNGNEPPLVKTVRAMGGDVNSDRHQFSRSVAERVLTTGERVVTRSARSDARLSGAESIHRMQLDALVCVPIHSEGRRGVAMGAIYIEMSYAAAQSIDQELSVLEAFADLAAVALSRAKLSDENEAQSRALVEANRELLKAREELAAHLAQRTAELQSTRLELEVAKADIRGGEGVGQLIGASEPMRGLYARIERVRDLDIVALVVGESGTGKELVARAIHDTGARSKKPFVAINCGAIAANLLESELFGHERGAFTGADRARLGVFREAQGGTVFLDEIGELPLPMQAAFLRVLQERRARPLGGRDEFAVEARIVVATNRELKQRVADGLFREDLYYRLNVVELVVPPLRTRQGDIPMLVDHFLRRFARAHSRPRAMVDRDALAYLTGHPWPGNVRQLEHELLQAWILSDRSVLSRTDFPEANLPAAPLPARELPPIKTEEARKNREHDAILAALNKTGWNRQAAAALLGIPRRTFYRRLEAYGILTPREHSDA